MDGETRALESILRELDDGLRELYGERHRGLVLYGSHARGEAYDCSDVDLLLLLEGEVGVSREIRRSSGLVAALSLEAGRVLSLIPENMRITGLLPILAWSTPAEKVTSSHLPDERAFETPRPTPRQSAALIRSRRGLAGGRPRRLRCLPRLLWLFPCGLRQAADYSAVPCAVRQEDAEHTIREGKAFLAAAREHLDR